MDATRLVLIDRAVKQGLAALGFPVRRSSSGAGARSCGKRGMAPLTGASGSDRRCALDDVRPRITDEGRGDERRRDGAL
jgi:hypothetical protein